ncbi:LysR family transcriptional regulator [Trinickia terrae]|uniref:LysR family transcriptional regulator n=1 Tax=Trinickia terrae TaxID=2571161 RepID=A0A4U1I4T1_9BURK|nr:LysR substrate-binding domain-containing protein [Trinickia terrae]TKC88298.1 LysR family transcriptional regulator [Trinickia terrae]
MQIPSLRNLQVFEAAARHESFREAAESLFLTPGAVGRQVRALEAELGVVLFARVGRRVVLTPQGRELQEAMTGALKLLADSTTRLRRQPIQQAGRISVTVVPSFSSRWLGPRLKGFQASHPDIGVDVIATIATLNLVAKRISLGIRFGNGKWEGLVAELLADETLFPVAAAKGVNGCSGLPSSPHHILRYPLLNPYDEWGEWFKRAGVVGRIPDEGVTCEDSLALLQAAERGDGIALARGWLVGDALKSGALVRLPGPAISARRGYYLVYPEGQSLSVSASKFISWLKKEIRAAQAEQTS